LGKKTLGAALGGLRLASLDRAERALALPPFWQVELGNYLLMGVVSSLLALPVYEPETQRPELPMWREHREAHLESIRRAFRQLRPAQRVILFCHDPTALPFLWQEPVIRGKLPQIERTIIGHLHSRLVLAKSRILAGMPVIPFLGHTTRRLTCALHQARLWEPFNLLLCPSLAGIELVRSGGFYTAELDLSGKHAAVFRLHHLPREAPP